jgi:hypothetical protein
MAGMLIFFPLGVVTPDQINDIFFGFYMGNADKIIDIPIAELASVLHFRYPLL